MPQSLAGKRIGLIVDDGGWRNTSALDLGIQAMGSICVKLPISSSGGEALEDLAGYLGNWVDLVAIRTPQLKQLQMFANAVSIPVLNLRTKANHPCETLGDLSFLQTKHGSLDALTIVAVAPVGNILQSWVEAAQVLPIRLIQLYDADYLMTAESAAVGQIEVTDDITALHHADVLMTDCWPQNANTERLRHYQITANRLDKLKASCSFIPCPPVARGNEVSADAMLHKSCCATTAKAYLLHGQNAYLEWALSNS